MTFSIPFLKIQVSVECRREAGKVESKDDLQKAAIPAYMLRNAKLRHSQQMSPESQGSSTK